MNDVLGAADCGQTDFSVPFEQKVEVRLELIELLEKRGFQKPPWLTPTEFARVLRAPNMASVVAEATAAYNELRFGGRRDAAARMMHALELMRQL